MWFVNGSITGIQAPFLLDSGSDISIISRHYLELLDDSAQMMLRPLIRQLRFKGVWGDEATSIGIVNVPIRLGGAYFQLEAFVMDVECNNILGWRFLNHYRIQYDHDRELILLEEKLPAPP